MKTRVGLLVAALLLNVAGPATADKKSQKDADDVNGVLDIQTVSHAHGAKGKLAHIVRTIETWPDDALADEESWISILFDVDKDRNDPFGENRNMRIDYDEERGLHAEMYTQGIGGPGEFVGNAALSRPTESSVKVVFAKRLLKKRIKQYWWRAITSYEDDGDCASDPDSAYQGGCLDYIPPPTKMGIRHDLR